MAQAQTTKRTADETHLANNRGPYTVYPDDSYILSRFTTKPPTRLHTMWRGPLRVVSHHKNDYTLFDVVTKKTYMCTCQFVKDIYL